MEPLFVPNTVLANTRALPNPSLWEIWQPIKACINTKDSAVQQYCQVLYVSLSHGFHDGNKDYINAHHSHMAIHNWVKLICKLADKKLELMDQAVI